MVRSNRTHSMFLCGMEDRNITEVVNNFKNKTLTNVKFIDICILKEAIHSIVKPLTCAKIFPFKWASSHKK